LRHLGVQEKETKLPTGRQLDFWPGGRVVSWGDGQRGTHRIARILGGQTIQENFNGRLTLNLQGMSPSAQHPRLGIWQQSWADSQGCYWPFSAR
jgi:hypothetical protein